MYVDVEAVWPQLLITVKLQKKNYKKLKCKSCTISLKAEQSKTRSRC